MCPVCLTTAALLAAGATSTGGLTALFMKFPVENREQKNQVVKEASAWQRPK